MKDVNAILFIRHEEQLKKWKEHFTTVIYCITSGEVPSLVDEMANHHNVRIRAVPPSRKEIISVINELKQSTVDGLDDFPAEIINAAPAVSEDLLLRLIRNSQVAKDNS